MAAVPEEMSECAPDCKAGQGQEHMARRKDKVHPLWSRSVFKNVPSYISASYDGIEAVQASDIEDIVFDEMRRKLAEFTELLVKERQGNPIELTKLKVRADEIEKNRHAHRQNCVCKSGDHGIYQ